LRRRLCRGSCSLIVLLSFGAFFGAASAAGRARSHPLILHPVFHRSVTTGRVNYAWTGRPYVFVATPFGRNGKLVPRQRGIAINELTGKRRSVLAPDGCDEGDGIGAGQLLFNCGLSGLEVYSLSSGSLRAVAVSPKLVNFETPCDPANSDLEWECGIEPVGIGADWLEFHKLCGGHCFDTGYPPDTYVFENTRTGEVRADPSGGTSYADLSSPNLARRLCSPVTVPEVAPAYFDSAGAPHSAPGSIASDGNFAIATGGRIDAASGIPFRSYLERCGTRLHQLVGPATGVEPDHAPPDQYRAGWCVAPACGPTANSHAVVWEPGNEARSRCQGLQLNGLYLPDRHRFTLCVPVAASLASFSEVVLSSRTLFVLNTKGQLWTASGPTERH
jgi:hypothetical protein